MDRFDSMMQSAVPGAQSRQLVWGIDIRDDQNEDVLVDWRTLGILAQKLTL